MMQAGPKLSVVIKTGLGESIFWATGMLNAFLLIQLVVLLTSSLSNPHW